MRHDERLKQVMGKVEELLLTRATVSCDEVGLALGVHGGTVRAVLNVAMRKRGARESLPWNGRTIQLRQKIGLCWQDSAPVRQCRKPRLREQRRLMTQEEVNAKMRARAGRI